MDHLTPLSSSPSLQSRRHLPETKALAGPERLCLLNVAMVKYQSMEKASLGNRCVLVGGDVGNLQPIKVAVRWGICHSDLPLPEAGGSLKSHLPFSVAGS